MVVNVRFLLSKCFPEDFFLICKEDKKIIGTFAALLFLGLLRP